MTDEDLTTKDGDGVELEEGAPTEPPADDNEAAPHPGACWVASVTVRLPVLGLDAGADGVPDEARAAQRLGYALDAATTALRQRSQGVAGCSCEVDGIDLA